MSELLKERYNQKFIKSLSVVLKKHYPIFSVKNFKKNIFDKSWESRELKSRMNHIAYTIGLHYPKEYKKAINLLKKCAESFCDLEAMVFPEYVEIYGQEDSDWSTSMSALEHFTKFSSSEFAIRPFILKDPVRAMKQVEKWSKSKNEHVRRLASEGCRPRLPWAMSLPLFKKNPRPILPILNNLKEDSSLYVRRSVANNLNDIAKDNSNLVLTTVKKWSKIKNDDTKWLIKHALRTLLKQGDPDALSLVGIKPNIKVLKASITIKPSNVRIGSVLEFSTVFELKNTNNLRIEYIVGFLKKNGNNVKKIFKLREKNYLKGNHQIEKRHSFKLISTRNYYPGKHFLYLVINGKEYAKTEFILKRMNT